MTLQLPPAPKNLYIFCFLLITQNCLFLRWKEPASSLIMSSHISYNHFDIIFTHNYSALLNFSPLFQVFAYDISYSCYLSRAARYRTRLTAPIGSDQAIFPKMKKTASSLSSTVAVMFPQKLSVALSMLFFSASLIAGFSAATVNLAFSFLSFLLGQLRFEEEPNASSLVAPLSSKAWQRYPTCVEDYWFGLRFD